ncbi:hypothetical protein [Gimesia fumaroli]|uniref:Uncharacterized protein n=1 Tax=Gimesia fumaroli TaxID=2527976 RepID=A0A518ICF0_9PLAN|nr:hypothetical protein [Gimesia fumaroli]QDV50781.1 hypothetical protein Enr17x_28250 [Gimesia fumaroli]
MNLVKQFLILSALMVNVTISMGAHPYSAPGVTSLTNPRVKYKLTDQHAVVLKRGKVTAIIVDNAAINTGQLPGHRAGYNGVASLKYEGQTENLFVPAVAGLNFEHIHDGTPALKEKFEPRKHPMQLRIISDDTVELYQSPTPNWKLESCGRYQLLDDGTIEYTFECIPRAALFKKGYIGLFWASYMQAPEDRRIYFYGKAKSALNHGESLIAARTPAHGVDSTHPPDNATFFPNVSAEFPLTLVNHPSRYVYSQPWFYGIRQKYSYTQMFRKRDQIWFAQSPTGGGKQNPAWDFQWFIPNYKVGEAYGFVMRAHYAPWTDHGTLQHSIQTQLSALAQK